MHTKGVTRIAHLSDVHMLAPRPSRDRSGWSMRVRFLNLGRPLDAAARREKLERALATARRVGADHVVVSGDLTEVGAPDEFETLAATLHDSGIAPERVTLVPGNHDVYSSPDAWRWAMGGPLAAFAASSAREAGRPIEIERATLLPLDATLHQPVTRSAGILTDDAIDAVARRVSDAAFASKPIVLVQHHPPFVRKTSALHWIDGLMGAHRLMALLEAFRNLFVLHGHLHAIVDRAIASGVPRIFGATAVVDDRDAPRVRLYDVRDGRLEAAGLVA